MQYNLPSFPLVKSNTSFNMPDTMKVLSSQYNDNDNDNDNNNINTYNNINKKYNIPPLMHTPTYDNYMYAYNNLKYISRDDIAFVFSSPIIYNNSIVYNTISYTNIIFLRKVFINDIPYYDIVNYYEDENHEGFIQFEPIKVRFNIMK